MKEAKYNVIFWQKVVLDCLEGRKPWELQLLLALTEALCICYICLPSILELCIVTYHVVSMQLKATAAAHACLALFEMPNSNQFDNLSISIFSKISFSKSISIYIYIYRYIEQGCARLIMQQNNETWYSFFTSFLIFKIWISTFESNVGASSCL